MAHLRWSWVTAIAAVAAAAVLLLHLRQRLSPGERAYVHHRITTNSPEAQRYFDDGLSAAYGFEFDLATDLFTEAARKDPQAPMPYWGIAVANGPNYNAPIVSPRNRHRASAAEAAALARVQAGGEESDLIGAEALALDPTPARAPEYIEAMRAIHSKYPDDPDAEVLLAEGLMQTRSWHLWDESGHADSAAVEAENLLEEALRRWPNHVGANHLYIHLMEGSPFPERALPSAYRLTTAAPTLGHLLHMPAHIFIRTGDYSNAVSSGEEARQADERLLREAPSAPYLVGYAIHNCVFAAMAAAFDGEYDRAIGFAGAASTLATDPAANGRPRESALALRYQIQVRFAKWREILREPAPNGGLHGTVYMWHFARACAYAALGDVTEARMESDAVADAYRWIPAGQQWGIPAVAWPSIDSLATLTLRARIAAAGGDWQDALTLLNQAVSLQDKLPYMEPPPWPPIREILGAALLKRGDWRGAEITFRDELEKDPRDPRALFGLERALAAEGNGPAAADVHVEFLNAWRGRDASPLDGVI